MCKELNGEEKSITKTTINWEEKKSWAISRMWFSEKFQPQSLELQREEGNR